MEKEILRIALAQINCTVGDLSGNSSKILRYIQMAKDSSADIIAFPELALTGYPPEDLLLKPSFIEDNLSTLKELVKTVDGITVVLGFVDKIGKDIFNAAAIIYNGRVCGTFQKTILPNYGVFDEKRYFSSGKNAPVFSLGKVIFGVNICEDIWHLEGPTKDQAKARARLIININASPYYAGKVLEREAIIRKQARLNRAYITYTNLVGGQDELVFDGQSMVVDDLGRVIARAEAFKEELLIVDLKIPESKSVRARSAIRIIDKLASKDKSVTVIKETGLLDPVAEIYQALLSGLKDYVTKNGFKKVIIGLSGGIDSSLVVAIASDALGKDNVIGVFMPTRYSSSESEIDARQVAGNLGIEFIALSIEQTYKMYLVVLEPLFAGTQRNIAEENLQARIRGNILMALSNKFGWLVLTTGNKSEMSTGYATLYGDMAGGFAVIKDVPKIMVYKLSRYRNSLGVVIPERVLTKEPTAELKPDQKDRDTLPAYEELDPILKAYVEEDKDAANIISLGFDSQTVSKVISMVDKSEYKRRQSPPGIKITPKAFGRDRRMPITNKYRGQNGI
ncbi:MAG: NAD+ synthase [Candidatus Omnitrophica bacterium]|nr:NAD+ synthase [Candidatus Omnitrophota bacterium]